MEKYLIQCTSCGNRVFSDGKDLHGLIEIPYAPPPRRANGINNETVSLGKRFRCTQCGNLMKARKAPEPEAIKPPDQPQDDRPVDIDEMLERRRKPAPRVEDFISEIDRMFKK